MEEKDNHACFLELQGGYHSTHPYPQKFVKAPLSQHPSKAPSQEKEVSHHEVMNQVMRAR